MGRTVANNNKKKKEREHTNTRAKFMYIINRKKRLGSNDIKY